jgi:hypothetical protein
LFHVVTSLCLDWSIEFFVWHLWVRIHFSWQFFGVPDMNWTLRVAEKWPCVWPKYCPLQRPVLTNFWCEAR